MPTLGDYTNVYSTAVNVMREKGFQVWVDAESESFHAERDGWDFLAESPTALLGLIAVFEHVRPKEFGEYWWRVGPDAGSYGRLPRKPERGFVSRIQAPSK